MYFFASVLLGACLVQAEVLRNFQVAQPPVVPQDAKQCTIQVLQRDFAFSYGSPEIVTLEPPTDCGEPGSWSAITLNLTVTSNGTQYDRLGIFSVNQTETLGRRTSTPEPTRGDGIIWTYIKDVTPYIPLFATTNTFIFQLDNIIQEGLDGVYSTVVHATYYAASDSAGTAKQSDLIIPLSTRSNDSASVISVPPAYNISVAFPQNTVQVYAEVFASGNSQEEFWFSNTANEYLDDIPLGESITWGNGPFREVRVQLDDKIVGTVFPFVPIFTGGAAPSLWRPISAYGAIELPTYHLDLTAFVPLLTDGQNHTFTLSVVSAEPDHTTLNNWYLTANLQVVLDSSDAPTTGNITVYEVDSEYPQTSVEGVVANDGENVDITVTGSRKIHVESVVVSGSGETNNVVWTQDLAFSNVQNFRQSGIIQVVDQKSTGTVKSTHNGVTVVEDKFDYPLLFNLTYLDTEALRNWTVTIDHAYNRDLHANPFTLGSQIASQQSGWAFYQIRTGGNFGNGTNNNTFYYSDDAGNTYSRKVNAAYNVITLDEESGSLAPYPVAETLVGSETGDVQEVVKFAGSGRLGGHDDE